MPVQAVKDKETTPTNLRQKLVACMAGIDRVAKRGENITQHYSYATAADIVDQARIVMALHGIAFLAHEEKIEALPDYTTKSGATMSVVRVTMKFSFLDADSDERLDVTSTGEGQDTGDKALPKAKTMSLKYCLQQNLLMSTGDDPEDDKGGREDQVRERPQASRGEAPCPKCGHVGSFIMKRDGTWACWGSKGGCETVMTNEDYLKLLNPKGPPAPKMPNVQPINEPPEDEPIEETVVSTNGGRSERVVSTPDQTQHLRTLIAQSSQPSVTEEHILKQCAVQTLEDLTPQQAEWMIETLQRRVQQRTEGNGGKKQPRR